MPLANDTREDCYHYQQPPILTNLTAGSTSSSCADVAAAFDITTDDLITWNPPLNTTTAGDCILDNNYRYCVLAYEAALNVSQYCDQYALPSPGFTCAQFANSYGVELGQFVLRNPSVGPGCADFSGGLSYCVSVYGFRQSGAIPTCNLWAMANDTQWVDQPCQILETQFGLSHARFVAWNPAVQTNCSGIYPGYEYCVSIPNYRPTYMTPSTSVQVTAGLASSLETSADALAVTTSAAGGSASDLEASGRGSSVASSTTSSRSTSE